MKFDKENIMMIEFEQAYPGGHKIPMVALFNRNKVSEAEVKDAIATYGMGEPQTIVIITKTQYENVFIREAIKR